MHISQARFDGIHSVWNVVDQKVNLIVTGSKVRDTGHGHLLQVLVVLGENVGNDLCIRSSSYHELKKSRSHIANVSNSLRPCRGHLVSQFGELTVGVVKVSQRTGELVKFGSLLVAHGNLIILSRDKSGELCLKCRSKILAVLAMRMAELLRVR